MNDWKILQIQLILRKDEVMILFLQTVSMNRSAATHQKKNMLCAYVMVGSTKRFTSK